MTQTSLQNNYYWNVKGLVIANLLALLLILSWIFEPTRSFWQFLDDKTFWFFNQSLANGGDGYRYFWALTNMQEFDKVVALFLLGIFVVEAVRKGRKAWGRLIGIFTLLMIVLGIWTGYGNHTGIGQLIPVERLSGTLVYPESFRLAEWSTELKTKDASPDSFPGDHGMILLIFSGFIFHYFSRPLAWFSLILAIAGTMPRVVSGGHWLSDEIVGAVFISVLALSWSFHTPLGRFVVETVERFVNKVIEFVFGKLPD